LSHYNERLIALAVDFANTYDPFLDEPEALQHPADLKRFLERCYIEISEGVKEEELLAARQLRDELREIFMWIESGEVRGKIVDAINVMLSGAVVSVRAENNDGWHLEYSPADRSPIISKLAVKMGIGLTLALQQHGPERLKMCKAQPCEEVFIDLSKNKSRRFCGERCANRYNVANFRERQRSD
jgi:predicted RNA-binding Zn ribbon-like protein